MRFAGSLHDALNRLAHLVAGPVERAERAIADGAVRTDEVARGQNGRAPGLRRLRVAIEEPGKARRYRVGERARDAGALGDVDGEHGEGLALQSAAQALYARHLFAAGGAPGGPEIDQHRLAAVIGKPVRAALEILQLQRRRGASAPGSQRLRRGKRRPGEQQRSQEPLPHQVISRARIAYTNASGSSWSSLSLPVSPFGYMRYGSFGPFACGSAMS